MRMTSTRVLRRRAVGGAIALAGCLLITACAGSSVSSTASGESAGRPAAPAGGTAGQSGGGAAQPGTGSAQPGGKPGVIAGLAAAGQDIVYTAQITIRTANVTADVQQVTAIAMAAGGYVSGENAPGDTSRPPGGTGPATTMTVKVPVAVYPKVLRQLSAPSLGRQLADRQQTSDVTQQVANAASLVTSQQDTINALEGLLKRAGSVPDLLQVQQQISSDETTLNSLLAQQGALNGETADATITMTLQRPPAPAKKVKRPPPARHSFFSGLAAGSRTLWHAAGWVVTVLGALLPWAIVAALLTAAGYALRRRLARRREAPPAVTG